MPYEIYYMKANLGTVFVGDSSYTQRLLWIALHTGMIPRVQPLPQFRSTCDSADWEDPTATAHWLGNTTRKLRVVVAHYTRGTVIGTPLNTASSVPSASTGGLNFGQVEDHVDLYSDHH